MEDERLQRNLGADPKPKIIEKKHPTSLLLSTIAPISHKSEILGVPKIIESFILR
jgi:hypothetical protein